MKLTAATLRQIIKEELEEIQGKGLQGDTTVPDKDPNNPLSGPTAAPDKQPVVAAMKNMSNRINAIEKLITKLIKNR